MLEPIREDYFSISNSNIEEDIYLQLYISIRDNFSISSLSEYNLLLNEFYNSCTMLMSLYNDNTSEYKIRILSYSIDVGIIIDKIKKFLSSLSKELNNNIFNELIKKILVDLNGLTKSKLEIDDDEIISDIQKKWLYRIDAINKIFEKDYIDYENETSKNNYGLLDCIGNLPLINIITSFIKQEETISQKKLINN